MGNKTAFKSFLEDVQKEISMTSGGYVHNDPKKKKTHPKAVKALGRQILESDHEQEEPTKHPIDEDCIDDDN